MGKIPAGIMFGEILDVVMDLAFPNWDSMDVHAPDDEDDTDMRKLNQRKVWRAKLKVREQCFTPLWPLVAWVSEPLDELWAGLQWSDNQGNSLMRLVGKRSQFRKCQHQFFRRLNADIKHGDLC
jgi:hypothetical protein